MSLLRTTYQKLKAPEFLIPVMATLLSVVAAELLVKNAFSVMRGDAVAYWDMAQVPIDPRMTWTWDGVPDSGIPYTYRILVPFIVRNFFGSSMGGFIFIAITSLLACNYLVYKISQLYTGKVWVSSFLVITFSTNFTVFLALLTTLVDLPSFVFMLTLVFIAAKSIMTKGTSGISYWLAFSVTLLVGVLIKEWILAVLPVLFLHLLYTRQIRKALLLLSFSLPAIVVHLVIRLILGPLFPEIQRPDLALNLGKYLASIGAYRALFATFGAIWLVVPFALFHAFRGRRDNKELYVPVFLAITVALAMGTLASDHDRYLFFMSFPFLIPALSLYLSQVNQRLTRHTLYTVAGLFLITRLAMHYRPEWQEAFAPTSGQSAGVILLIAAAAAVQILVIAYYLAAGSGWVRLPGTIHESDQGGG